MLPLHLQTSLIGVLVQEIQSQLPQPTEIARRFPCLNPGSILGKHDIKTPMPRVVHSPMGAKGAVIFHTSTKLEDRKLVTAGGRVLGVTCIDQDVDSAIALVFIMRYTRFSFRECLIAVILVIEYAVSWGLVTGGWEISHITEVTNLTQTKNCFFINLV
jgi:hypothetical protein